jgi:hypothetical protein
LPNGTTPGIERFPEMPLPAFHEIDLVEALPRISACTGMTFFEVGSPNDLRHRQAQPFLDIFEDEGGGKPVNSLEKRRFTPVTCACREGNDA